MKQIVKRQAEIVPQILTVDTNGELLVLKHSISYANTVYYMVHKLTAGNTWIFLPFSNSCGSYSGQHKTLQGLLDKALQEDTEIFQFDNVQEMITYLYREMM